jgi:predicted sulfurtransferase
MQKSRSILLAVLAVGITFYAVWSQHRPVVVKPATHEDVLAEAKKGGYRLIDTGKLWELYQKPDEVLIVDTRQEWEYRTGSVKGAVNFPMEPSWWSRWRKKTAMAKFLGPDKKRTVVFY